MLRISDAPMLNEDGLFHESSKGVIFAGLGALQGESLQDEPRLRGTKSSLFNTQPHRANGYSHLGALSPPYSDTSPETSSEILDQVIVIFIINKKRKEVKLPN